MPEAFPEHFPMPAVRGKESSTFASVLLLHLILIMVNAYD